MPDRVDVLSGVISKGERFIGSALGIQGGPGDLKSLRQDWFTLKLGCCPIRINDLPIPTRLLPIKEVAERLDLSKSKTVQLIRDGELDARELGRRVVVPDTAVATFIAGLPSAKREG